MYGLMQTQAIWCCLDALNYEFHEPQAMVPGDEICSPKHQEGTKQHDACFMGYNEGN